MRTAYIVDAIRTPVGRYGGGLNAIRPDDLLAFVLKMLLQRNPYLDVGDIEDVIAGATNQSGEDNRNVARMAALLAGLPVSVAGNTVNRLCASGLQAIMDTARAIQGNEGMGNLAAGVESMTRAPFVIAKSEGAWHRKPEIHDTTIGWRFINKRLASMYYPYNMGETAENMVTRWQISRQAQDAFAAASHEKYYKALADGKWQDEIAPVPVTPNGDGQVFFSKDEHPRITNLQTLAGLKPAFVKGGTVTAGNSSGINDGAAACLLMSEDGLKKYSLTPMARIVSLAVAGVDPAIMGIGSVPATHKALQRAGLTIQDIGLVELNEAFAVQALACIGELGIDPERVNVNGGSIAIGHALGSTGVRISTTLLHEMKRRKVRYGLACMCVGLGQGAAVIYENVM